MQRWLGKQVLGQTDKALKRIEHVNVAQAVVFRLVEQVDVTGWSKKQIAAFRHVIQSSLDELTKDAKDMRVLNGGKLSNVSRIDDGSDKK